MVLALTLLCVLCYVLAKWLANQNLTGQSTHPKAPLIALCAALMLHGILIYKTILLADNTINLNLRNTLIIISALCSLAGLIFYIIKQNTGLILSVAALASLLLLFSVLLPQSMHITNAKTMVHAGLSFSAYVLLGLAACQALIISFVHNRMRKKKSFSIIKNLPPIVEMEVMLFTTIALGFVLLTLALISGFIHLNDMFEQHVAHKTVFSIISWFSFGVLLTGRHFYGWRGKKAIRWTLIAFLLLCIAFLGTQFIKEVVLQ